mmetsp:Transcript_24404/g.38492  ORF Transcript_24404/g.38492 Transcript_24404/m.38492 type:complete len:219 (-) Transcript_24404:202-858(-)
MFWLAGETAMARPFSSCLSNFSTAASRVGTLGKRTKAKPLLSLVWRSVTRRTSSTSAISLNSSFKSSSVTSLARPPQKASALGTKSAGVPLDLSVAASSGFEILAGASSSPSSSLARFFDSSSSAGASVGASSSFTGSSAGASSSSAGSSAGSSSSLVGSSAGSSSSLAASSAASSSSLTGSKAGASSFAADFAGVSGAGSPFAAAGAGVGEETWPSM